MRSWSFQTLYGLFLGALLGLIADTTRMTTPDSAFAALLIGVLVSAIAAGFVFERMPIEDAPWEERHSWLLWLLVLPMVIAGLAREHILANRAIELAIDEIMSSCSRGHSIEIDHGFSTPLPIGDCEGEAHGHCLWLKYEGRGTTEGTPIACISANGNLPPYILEPTGFVLPLEIDRSCFIVLSLGVQTTTIAVLDDREGRVRIGICSDRPETLERLKKASPFKRHLFFQCSSQFSGEPCHKFSTP